jgi:hypothetical protein
VRYAELARADAKKTVLEGMSVQQLAATPDTTGAYLRLSEQQLSSTTAPSSSPGVS